MPYFSQKLKKHSFHCPTFSQKLKKQSLPTASYWLSEDEIAAKCEWRSQADQASVKTYLRICVKVEIQVETS